MPRLIVLTLLLLILVGTRGRAQESFEFPEQSRRIYPVSAHTMEGLLDGTMRVSELPNLGPALPSGTQTDTLPPGHYLEATVHGEEVAYRYFSTHQHWLDARAVAGKLQLRLTDARGRSRDDATILADGRPVRYRDQYQAYRRRDWRVDLLRITIDQDTLFYRVDETIRRSRFHHDLRRVYVFPPVYYALTPYRTVHRSYHYLKRSIREGNWRWYNYPFQGKIKRLLHPPRDITGYVTTSQPRYQPGDTLRVAAYFARPGGRPLPTDSVYLSLREEYPGKTRLLRKIGGNEPGRYVFELPIPPDWPLDRKYTIRFWKDGWASRDIAPTISFRLEDYELDEYRLSVSAAKDAREPGAAWVDVRANDVNGLALPEGILRVTTTLDRFGSVLDKATTLRLPDTLFTQTLPTDNQIDHRVVLPDSLFPAGYDLQLKVHVQLRGPSGEYQEKSVPLAVDRRHPVFPRIDLRGDSVEFSYAPRAAEITDTRATLLAIAPGQDTTNRLVTLPFTLPVDHGLENYQLRFQGQTARRPLTALTPTGARALLWSRDTLRVHFPNAYRQELRWTLLINEKVLAVGGGASPRFTRAGFAPATTARLRYQFFAGGKWRHEERTAEASRYFGRTDHPQLLELALEQPATVRPGETVRVTVRATNHAGKPAGGVRLAAGSYNARFSELPVTTPTFLKKEKRRRRRQGYQANPANWSTESVPPTWLIKGLNLNTALAYRLRYPSPEFRYERDLDTLLPPDLTVVAHLAPFVIRDHRPVRIRTLYADDRLVYWWHPNQRTPYSIPLDSGWHELELRTDDFHYHKRVYLPARRQTVISFDASRAGGAGWRVVQRKETPATETDQLYDRVFALAQMQPSLTYRYRQGTGGMLRSGVTGGYKNFYPLGLARSNDRLDFWFPDGDSTRLIFEPRATYRITLGRDRLYPLERSTILAAQQRSVRVGAAAPGLPHYRKGPLTTRPTRQRHTFSLPRPAPAEERGRLQLTGLPDSLLAVTLGVPRLDAFYRLEPEKANAIAVGSYDLLYHFRSDSVFHRRVAVTQDSLLLLRYDRTALTYYDQYSEALGYRYTRPEAEPEPKSRLLDREYHFGGDRLSGVVTDVSGEPLIGASVLIAGTNQGTVTDLDGAFTLEVPAEEYTLEVHYTGFTPFRLQDIRGGTVGTPLAIHLEESASHLDQVVVVGYGIAKRREVTGSVTSLSAAAPIIVRGFSGQTAGLQITDAAPNVTSNALRANLLPPPTIRESFADYAAFLPSLRTDAAGRATFDVTFPDDITAWNTYAVGQDGHRRVGFTQVQTTAFLPLQAQLYLPRFLVGGDRSHASTLAINRTGTERDVRLQFSGTNFPARTQDAGLGASLATDYPITAPADADSLTYTFNLQTLDGEPTGDGEERSIPVFPRGSEVISGELLLLTDTAQALPDGFVRPERGPVILRLLGNRLEQLLKDVDYIVKYPYSCSEQTASRLIGLLALRDIRRSEGKPLDRQADINKMIARLRKLQRPDGGFGWWPDAERSSPWISLHAYRALAVAGEFSTPDLQPLRRYLLAVAAKLPRPDQLQIALVLAEDGFAPTREEMIRLDTSSAPTDFELLAISRLRQLRGDTVDVQRILDSASHHAILGRYWGERRFRFYRQPLDDRLACSLLAQRILTAAGQDKAATETVNYLLGQTPTRTRPGVEPLLGTNTLESAHLVAELLPYLLRNEQRLTPPTVILTSATDQTTVTTFPYETSVPPAELASFQLERKGSGPLPVSLHQRWFATEPSARANGFQLETALTDARSRPLPYLTKGTTAYLETKVTVKADADYVLIEIPIPAGCSYANRSEPRGPHAVHRTYRRDRVAIFCDRLPAGTYTYRVALAPRFAGTYSLNPARAEMQYVPAVYGNGTVREVRIE